MSSDLRAFRNLPKQESELIFALLETPVLRRLSRIRQLGFAYLAFPNAQHSRLEHTTLSLELMCAVLNGIKNLDSDKRRHLIAAVLLQDVGQAPFSNSLNHSFPCFSSIRLQNVPEDIARSVEVVKWLYNSDPTLKNCGIELDYILPLLAGDPPWPDMHWVKAVLDSELDIDRLIYLSQDSAATKIKIPSVRDVIKNLALNYGGNTATIGINASGSSAQFIFSRGELYTSVYLHPIKLAVESLVSEFLRLYWISDETAQIVPRFPKPRKVDEFLEWTDFTIIQSITDPDPIHPNPKLNRIRDGLISGELQVAEAEDLHNETTDFTAINSQLKEFEKLFDPSAFIRILYTDNLPTFKFYTPGSVLLKDRHSYVPLEQSCRDLQSPNATRPLKHRPLIIFHGSSMFVMGS